MYVTLGNVELYVKQKEWFQCRRFGFKCISTLYLCREKGFVVTTIGKVVNKFISTLYAILTAGTDAAKAKYQL